VQRPRRFGPAGAAGQLRLPTAVEWQICRATARRRHRRRGDATLPWCRCSSVGLRSVRGGLRRPTACRAGWSGRGNLTRRQFGTRSDEVQTAEPGACEVYTYRLVRGLLPGSGYPAA